jgi:hypothetical protein
MANAPENWKEALVVYTSSQFAKHVTEELSGGLCQLYPFIVEDKRDGWEPLIDRINAFYKKAWRRKWWQRLVVRWISVNKKIGTRDRLVLFDSQVFRVKGPSRFDLLKEINDSVRSYYLLTVLATLDPDGDRKDAYNAEASIVLDANFTARKLDDEVLGARNAEARALGERRRGWYGQILISLGTLLLAALVRL